MPKAAPNRTCVGCFKIFPQNELVRIVKRPDGTIEAERPNDTPKGGRGVYLCPNWQCFTRATKRKGKDALSHGLKVKVSTDLIDQISGFFS